MAHPSSWSPPTAGLPGNQLPGIDEDADLSDLSFLPGVGFCGALPIFADPVTIGRDGPAAAYCYPPGGQISWEDNIFDFLDNIDPVALEELSVPEVATTLPAPILDEQQLGPANRAPATCEPGDVVACHRIQAQITQHFQQPCTAGSALRIECRNPVEEVIILSLSSELRLDVRFELPPLPRGKESAPRIAIVSQPASAKHDQCVAHPGQEIETLDKMHAVVPIDMGGDVIRRNQAVITDCEEPLHPSPNLNSGFAWPHNQVDSTYTVMGSRHHDADGPLQETASFFSAAQAKDSSTTSLASRQGQGLRRKVSSAFTKLTRNNRRDLDKVGGTCWPCKVRRKQCDDGAICRQCQKAGNRGGPICPRGPLWDSTRLQTICPSSHLPHSLPVPRSTPTEPRPGRDAADRFLRDVMSRRDDDIRRIQHEGPQAEDENNRGILVKLITVEVEDLVGIIRTGGSPKDFINLTRTEGSPRDFSYGHLLAELAWELMDNPSAASVLGIDPHEVEDLVLFLERACRDEARYNRTRLNYSSVNCLLGSLKALRLLSEGFLTQMDHCSCNDRQCALFKLCGLDESIHEYVKMLTSAMFYKKRAEGDHWLLVFFSLTIQSYVRLALIAIERQLVRPQAGGSASCLASFGYLHMATTLFNAISAQKGHSLARRLQDTPRKPSAYASVPSLDNMSNQRAVSSTVKTGNWDGWRKSGTERHLRRIFNLDDGPGLLLIDALDEEPDSDDTIMSPHVPHGSRRNRESNGSLLLSRKKVHLTTTSDSASTSSERVPTPHLSEYSKTSWGSPSIFSSVGTETSSLLSFPATDNDSVYTLRWDAIEPLEQNPSAFQHTMLPSDQPLPDDKAFQLRPAPSFQCSCCRNPTRFVTSDDLNTHRRQRPHGCPHCDLRFTKNSGLQRHINTRHETLTVWTCADLLQAALGLDTGGCATPCRLCCEPIQAVGDAGSVAAQLLSHTKSRHAIGRCDQVEFARSDHFRDHLRGFHGVTNEGFLRELVEHCKACNRGGQSTSG